MDTPADGRSGSPTTARQVLEAYARLTPGATRRRRVVAGDITWLGQSLDRTASVPQVPLVGPGSKGPTMRNSPFDAVVVPIPTSPVQPADPRVRTTAPLDEDVRLPDPARIMSIRPEVFGSDVRDASGQPVRNGTRELSVLAARTRLAGPDAHLRLGWVYLTGRTEVDGRSQKVLVPLLSRRVDLVQSSFLERGLNAALHLQAAGEWRLEPRSDWWSELEVPPSTMFDELVDHPVWWADLPKESASRNARSEHRRRLRAWIEAMGSAAGLAVADVTTDHPALHEDDDRIVACVGYGLLRSDERLQSGSAESLHSWSERPGIDATAFAWMLDGPIDGAGDATPTPEELDELRSPLALNRSQARIVITCRTAATTVVSGAPGTGKSHLVAAIAADLTARGESVLVATRSTYAADVLATMLTRHPGPVPICFGSPEARQAALDEIERRLAEPSVSGAKLLLEQAEQQRRAVRARVLELLGRLEAAGRWEQRRVLLTAHRESAPGLFAPGVDLVRVQELAGAIGPDASWWRRWTASRALRRMSGCRDLRVLPDALMTAVSSAAEDSLADADEEFTDLWAALASAEEDVRHWTGRIMDDLVEERAGSTGGRRALTSLHATLRAGTASRQRLLESLPARDLAQAAPLWLGTLGEIDQLLPHTPAMFDVVILDEASQIDQPSAAPALLRGRRSVIVGDPRQLRHVSFVADEHQDEAFEATGVDEAARLDVRRNSVLDLAAGASPVRWLSEHHRSVPHLIQFSVDHFYDGHVTLATRHPRNECIDAIDVVRTDGDVIARVDRLLRELQRSGVKSVGVVTPFRDVADAIADRVLASEDGPSRIDAMDLQVGTVHQFQGSERDVVVVVPGLTEDDPAGRRAFVTDPHLFNVMITRARRRMLVVTDLPSTGTDLLAEFLQWGDRPPPRVPDGEPTSALARRLGTAISDAGGEVRHAYPVGDWTVDLCVGDGREAVGVICGLHPEGSAAHIERHLALTASGWRLRDPVVDGGDGVVEVALGLLGDGVHPG